MAVYLWRTDKESQSGPEIEVTVDRVAQSFVADISRQLSSPSPRLLRLPVSHYLNRASSCPVFRYNASAKTNRKYRQGEAEACAP